MDKKHEAIVVSKRTINKEILPNSFFILCDECGHESTLSKHHIILGAKALSNGTLRFEIEEIDGTKCCESSFSILCKESRLTIVSSKLTKVTEVNQ